MSTAKSWEMRLWKNSAIALRSCAPQPMGDAIALQGMEALVEKKGVDDRNGRRDRGRTPPTGRRAPPRRCPDRRRSPLRRSRAPPAGSDPRRPACAPGDRTAPAPAGHACRMVAWTKPASAGSRSAMASASARRPFPDRIAARQFFARDCHGIPSFKARLLPRNLVEFQNARKQAMFPRFSPLRWPRPDGPPCFNPHAQPGIHVRQKRRLFNLPAPRGARPAAQPPLRLGQGDGRAGAVQEAAGADSAGGRRARPITASCSPGASSCSRARAGRAPATSWRR